MGKLFAGIVAVTALIACGDRMERPAPTNACVESCFRYRLSSLSSIDHEQPTADALLALESICRRISVPCCSTPGAGTHVCRSEHTTDAGLGEGEER